MLECELTKSIFLYEIVLLSHVASINTLGNVKVVFIRHQSPHLLCPFISFSILYSFDQLHKVLPYFHPRSDSLSLSAATLPVPSVRGFNFIQITHQLKHASRIHLIEAKVLGFSFPFWFFLLPRVFIKKTHTREQARSSRPHLSTFPLWLWFKRETAFLKGQWNNRLLCITLFYFFCLAKLMTLEASSAIYTFEMREENKKCLNLLWCYYFLFSFFLFLLLLWVRIIYGAASTLCGV